MKINTKKIINFIDSLENDEMGFYIFGMASFFWEIIDPDFDPATDAPDLNNIAECMSEQQQTCLFPVGLEFFLSNEYPNPETGQMWNVIDAFLERCGKTLTTDEKKYYQGLRSSYMSLYEVIDIEVGKSLTLRDMMQKNSKPIKITENKATHHLSKWDFIGARLVKVGTQYQLAGGLLLMERDCVDELVEYIRKMDELVLQTVRSLSGGREAELMIKKMWVKIIAEVWFEISSRPAQETELFNKDGERFKLCTTTFPLKVATSKAVASLNALEELEFDNEDRHWIWLKESYLNQEISVVKEGSEGKKIFTDTTVQAEDGTNYSLYAELSIKKKQLIVEVNSEQRATIVEFFLKEKLGKMIGEPTINIKIPEEFPDKGEGDSISEAHVASREEIAVVQTMMDQHYRAWVDNKIPVLGSKSPREAMKTKEGRKNVISLLKEFENIEARKSRTMPEQRYDFGWLFEELGIKASEL